VFNPNLRVDTVKLENGNVCYIVDDALAEPEAAVRYAIERREQFVPGEDGGYPGLTLALPSSLAPAILSFFSTYMRPRFDARRLMHGMCRYSIVTLPASELRPTQMICHRDEPVGNKQYSVAAAVLYLFRDQNFGGTSFYETARPASHSAQLFGDSRIMSSAEFAAAYGLPRTYLTASNAYFTRIGSVAPRWNRMVFYDASILHSGDIFTLERLTSDPATGRLTLNFFYSSRRHLA
jgi:hypothetical protein